MNPQYRVDFLVIGVQKSATTWLFDCLKEHPDLCLPQKKREVEYLGGSLFEKNGAAWFFERFRDTENKQRGDVSVEYIIDPKAANAIYQYIPKVKLIVSLRDPIARSISAYYWYLRKNEIPDVPLEEGLRKVVDIYYYEGFESKNHLMDILKRGIYDVQLEHYFSLFPPEQFLFLLYEDINTFPLETWQIICQYIDITPEFVPSKLSSKPKINTYLKPMIALQRYFPTSRIVGKSVDITNQFFANAGIRKKNPTLSPKLNQELKSIFKPHVERTAELINRIPKNQQPLSSKSWLTQY